MQLRAFDAGNMFESVSVSIPSASRVFLTYLPHYPSYLILILQYPAFKTPPPHPYPELNPL